jgi:FMN reductase
MKILLVDGTIFGRKTGVLLEQVQQYVNEISSDLEVEILYFSKLQHQILDGSPLNDDMKMMIQKFEEADGFIFASPIFQASIPGVLKNAFDMIPPKSLRYKPAAIVGNGGTYQHHLVLEQHLRPILDYFRCLVTPNYVYTHADHFDQDNNITDENVHERLRELARVFVQYCETSKVLRQSAVEA